MSLLCWSRVPVSENTKNVSHQCIGCLHVAYMYVSSVMIQFYCRQRVGRFAKFIVFASDFAVFQYREATIMYSLKSRLFAIAIT